MITVDLLPKNSFWYLDTDGTTANTNTGYEGRRLLTTGAKSINEMIPLNRYSFFEKLERSRLPPMQLTIELTLNEGSELIHMAHGVDEGRVVVKRLYLWIPKLIPKDSMCSTYVAEYLQPKTWTYLRDLYNQSANTKALQNMFQISPAIDGFYPELEFDADSKIRIFNDLMTYAFRKNDYNTGTQLNLSNFTALYGLVYFDLTYQKEVVTRDPKQLILHYRLNVAPTADVRAHSIVFRETEVIVKTIGNELMIV